MCRWLKESTRTGVDETLDRRWSGEASVSSSKVGGACEIKVFRRSHHIYKSRLQLFDIAWSVEE
jgi:hypothetical protein